MPCYYYFMPGVEEARYKFAVIDRLRFVKRFYTNRELAILFGLPETVISRYTSGLVTPLKERAVEMNKVLDKIIKLDQMAWKLLEWIDDHLIFSRLREDTELLKVAALEAVSTYGGKRITKVMTADAWNSHFSSILAECLELPLARATDVEEADTYSSYRRALLSDYRRGAVYLNLAKSSINKKDSVLISSFIITDGKIERCMVDMVKEQAKAEVHGVIGLIESGEEYASTLSGVDTKVLLSPPPRKKRDY
jgi:adenine phosphoribosyltransferase